MAHQDVYIDPTVVAYDPDPPIVRPGDTVEFHIRNRTDTVIVEFVSSSPFSQNSLTLNGAVTALATQDKTVLTGATAGIYRFNAIPDVPKPLGGDPEPPGSLPGDLEVATDGPPPKY
jgi:plastocyanin